MLREVGIWMCANGQRIHGSKAWSIPGEGEMVDGHLRQVPGGKLGREHAEFQFGPSDFRFTIGSDGALYAYCMTVPVAGSVATIRSVNTADNRLGRLVRAVQLLGAPSETANWQQTADGLEIEMPTKEAAIAYGFRID